jgi:hypothetical protein
MAYYRIPLPIPSEPSIRLSTTLDGITYFIDLKWNTRDGHWFISLYDYAEVAIIEGLRVVIGYPLLLRVVDTSRPAGELYFIAANGDTAEDPGEELGDRWQLIYVDGDSYATAKAAYEAANA